MDGRRAAPARQQGGVNVDAAPFRYRQRSCGKNQAISDHDQRIELSIAEQRKRFRRPEIHRLMHGQSQLERAALHRAHLQCLPAAGGPIRLRENCRDTVLPGQFLERRHREVGRAGEAQLQRRSVARGWTQTGSYRAGA